jgi:two-component system cell cycle response regulator
MVMGRDVTCDIVLHDTRCSRKHAKLIYRNFAREGEPPYVVLADAGSTNGTFVNGNKLTGEQLLRDRDKILAGSSVMGFFLRDEWELEADQKLYTLARVDALTGLLNRGVLNIEMQREFERAQRYGRMMSLVMFDIDHFKIFNDTYGHQMGDFVLAELGRLVKANIRNHDIGARYGGEEFTIILPETTLEGALIQAERTRGAIVRHEFVREDVRVKITVSMGIASLEADVAHVDELVKRADQSLYKAKETGRNRICWMKDGAFVSLIDSIIKTVH